MIKYQYDPAQAVGEAIVSYDREQMCRFTIKLCERVKSDVGAGVYRGGIYPENISLSEDGELAIGPARREDWDGQEMEFLPPEQYWNGRLSPASDVYSIGMLLYYAFNKGKLPFEDSCRDAQLRRMGGESFEPPVAAGRRLGDIIRKATQFRPADRYQSMDELRALVESCLKNLYLGGSTSAETIFKKNDDDLSELERMMVSIIEKGEEEPLPEEEILSQVEIDEEPEPEYYEEAAEEEEAFEMEEDFVLAMEDDQEYLEYEASYDRPHDDYRAVPHLYEEKNPDLQPVVPRKRPDMGPAVQYTGQNGKKYLDEEEIAMRKTRPVALILVLCAFLVVAAILFNALIKDISARPEMQQQQVVEQQMQQPINVLEITPAPTQAPDPENTPLPGGLEETTVPPSEEPVEHRYELFVEDISWSDARDKCFDMGGRLLVINDEAEFAEICTLLGEKGVSMLWIGGRRENDVMLWEDGSENAFTPWAKGEPSYTDSSDGVSEDYVLLWYNNGWYFNDSRHDPCREFPQWYGGKMAYICEFGG